MAPWSLHMTWTWGLKQGKLARLQEARLWRGEAPGSTFHGAGGAGFLAMDMVQPQVQ